MTIKTEGFDDVLTRIERIRIAREYLSGKVVQVGAQGAEGSDFAEQYAPAVRIKARTGPSRKSGGGGGTTKKRGPSKKRPTKRAQFEGRNYVLRSSRNLTKADQLTIAEYGAPARRIPARATMRPFVEDNLKKIRAQMGRAGSIASRNKAKGAGKNPIPMVDKRLKRFALFLEAGIKDRITELRSPPLARSTIQQRIRLTGDSDPNPLVFTGGMRSAITGVVKDRLT